MSSHSCEKGVPKNMCVACGIEVDEARERDKQRKEDTRILFAAPEIQREIQREIDAERAQRKKNKEDPMAKMFLAIKREEELMMLAEAERQKEGELKKLSLEELLKLRKKWNGRYDEACCPATADHKHTWGPLTHCGNSWHGPVMGKDCNSCGYSWSSH
jgi:hypothetical protein